MTRSLLSTLLIRNWILVFVLFFLSGVVVFIEPFVAKELRIILLVVYFIISLFGTFFLSQSISKIISEPLSTIERRTKEINAGDFGMELAKPNILELASLSESINQMSQRLRDQIVDLTLEKEKFNSLLSNLQEGVFAFDEKGILLFQNKQIHSSLIPENSEARGLVEVIKNDKLRKVISDVLKKREGKKIEIETKNRFYSLRIYPIPSKYGAYVYIGVLTDKTEEKNNEMIRELFFQNASHELKTPITSIKGYAETLFERIPKNSDSIEKKFFEAILRNTERMILLVNDMLTISKLDSHKSEFIPEEFTFESIFENVKVLVEGTLQNKNQTLESNFPKDFTIFADSILLEHLLLNLISNASMYSAENTAIIVQGYEEETRSILQVVDRGIGISKEDKEKVFERFYRVDTNRSRKEGGTGLGLAIVLHIVNLHEGQIQILDNPLGGSIFQVELPKKIS